MGNWAAMTEPTLIEKSHRAKPGGGSFWEIMGDFALLYQRGIRFINIPTTYFSGRDRVLAGK